jgi:hypothetical protein
MISLAEVVFVEANEKIFEVGRIIVLKYVGVFEII